ncbi:cytohesin-1 isoform X1 [Eupeodes corollae]|uniref:cytohesin-1 isoform X1 n=1 Tax=Eupeodes corollae TaxID=290404 RepID=UPI0024924042|nr:cytohesin-1 isoform X1 [Eupeodes corollae]XP_055922998.1 cytohesin-1 isoform X1 [Eupeodes corollae]XP_055923006.1 cytohesin-1 isoform X1 [Eupeodes corollae]XP_055923014.1 cytohesin-1 isoform X1 [Eupeodes corollae]
MSSLQQQQQKRPSVSNWFSSLRRQPKNSKNKSIQADKKFQRSCIDLSSQSTFYIKPSSSPPPSGGGDGVSSSLVSITPPSPLPLAATSPLSSSTATTITAANSIDNLTAATADDDDDDRRGLVSGKRVSQFCSQCCCHLQPKKQLPTPPTSPLPPHHKHHKSPSTSSSSSSSYYRREHSLQYETESDEKSDIRIMRMASLSDEKTSVYSKRSEFKRIVTTKTTQTSIISRPVELLLNDRGEIVSRLDKQQRSSSLGCVLDESDDRSYSPIILNSSNVLDGDAGDFRYIDDSSTSHSETNVKENLLETPCNNNYNNINNNNSSDMCENCKNVIQQNKNNWKNSSVRSKKQIKDELCEVVSEMEALDVPEDCKHSNKDKQMSIGRKKFNMDPKKGIEYLVENRLLRMDPQDIAHFLYKGEGLNKTAIGDYLGEKNDLNEDVLKAFVALHDFTNLILVQALRQFLWSFRLPGEAQKIDRMMECFAQRYCQLNPDIFTNTDTCYVLSFAIIMLNTSLHNPSVKDKPTVEQFISMNRGINNGGDLPRGLLESLYESIRTEPFKIPQDDGNDLMHTFFNPDKEGWLWKQGGRYKSWKRRWFILNDNCLYYFEYTTDKEPRGIIPLENICVREIHDRSKPHCFELFATGGADIIKACKTDSEGKVVEGKHTVYRMSAATEEDQQEWIKRLTQSISHNPFYDILVQRKKKALSNS